MEQLRRCWNCKTLSPLDEMRYDLSGKDLICRQCLEKENRIKPPKPTEPTTIRIAAPESSFTIEPAEEKVSYQCGSCGFGFARKKGVDDYTCPYCGRKTVRIAFRDSAQKLLEEAEKSKFNE